MAKNTDTISLSDGTTFTYTIAALISYAPGREYHRSLEVAGQLDSANSQLQKSIYPKVAELDQGIQDANVLQGDFIGPLMSLTYDMNKDATTAFSSIAFCAITLREMGAVTYAKGKELKEKYG